VNVCEAEFKVGLNKATIGFVLSAKSLVSCGKKKFIFHAF
jgi:hypothetical protein